MVKHGKNAAMVLIGLALVAGVPGGQLRSETDQRASGQVGRRSDGSILLPTNQVITPAGRQIEFDGRPNALALSPDGRLAAVLNAAGNTVVIVDLVSCALTQRFGPGTTEISSPAEAARIASGSFAGIVFSKDGEKIYASQTDGRLIIATRGKDGKYIPESVQLPKTPIEIRGSGRNPYPGGLALSPNGKSLLVCLNRNNTLGVFDLTTRKLVREIPVGNAPVDVVVSGNRAYVSNRGGRPARPGEFTVDSSGTRILADRESASAISGTVSVVSLESGKEVASIEVGLHPTKLLLDGNRLFVANSNSDSVSIIDTAALRVVATIKILPFPGALLGSSPTGLAVVNDTQLLVSLGRNNALAVYELAGDPSHSAKLLGLIPTGWYPGDLAFDGRQGRVVVANTKGVGSLGPKVTSGQPKRTSRWRVGAHLGSVSILPAPTQAEIRPYTKQVFENNGWGRLPTPEPVRRQGAEAALPKPLPERLGDPSVFKHVFFIIKENKTYDQVLGDLPQGNGDPKLVHFGRRYTPNHHALAEQFILFDNFYAAGTKSVDGHQWLTQAFVVDYIEKAFGGFVRRYPFKGFDALAYSKTGFIWEHALKSGKSVRVYGEYAQLRKQIGDWRDFYDDYLMMTGQKEGAPRLKPETHSDIPSLQRVLAKDYPPFNMRVPDVYRAEVFLREFREFVKVGNLPDLIILALPADHTSGTKPGFPAPGAMVADNDLALGRIVEAISHSSYWKESVIFVIQDDAQSGVDHVDGHRTVAFVISPYTKRGVVDSHYYTNLTMTRTVLQILGTPAMNQLVMVVDPLSMKDVFTEKPDFKPFNAQQAEVPLDMMNPPLKAIRGVERKWALAMFKLNWDDVDAADWAQLNRSNWYAMKGFDTPYPGDSRVLLPSETHALKPTGGSRSQSGDGYD